MGAALTEDEVSILSTALLFKERASPHRGDVVMFYCADGKTRRMTKMQLVDLIDRLCVLCGSKEGANKTFAIEAEKVMRE